jgi:primosomal protein N'
MDGYILVGTNVLSKLYGLDTSLLVLHGWDDFLRMGGFRAREKMFQVHANLLDALKPGRIVVYARSDGLDLSLFRRPREFYTDELEKRREAEFPPYVRLFSINILDETEGGDRVMAEIARLTEQAGLDQQVLGPIEVKGHYGFRVILKGDGQDFAALFASLYRLPGVHIEADPLYV